MNHQTAVIHKEDIHPWLDVTMLEGVIKQDHVDSFLSIFAAEKILNPPCALLVYRHVDVLELLLHLIWLITDVSHRSVIIREQESPALSLVTPAEHSHMQLLFQQSDKILHMRRLACPSNSEITNRYNRSSK